MQWDWEFAREITPDLLRGLELTVLATVLASVVSLSLGLVWAIVRRSQHPVGAGAVGAFTEFIRRTPVLVQLYFIFYVLPTTGITLTPLVAGVVGLGLHYSTYTSEIYRAGIAAVDRGQWEAAMVLDLPRHRVWRSVVLPQAVPKVLPALGNTIVAMFKETALLSAITVQEVLGVGREIGTETYDYTEPLLLAGAFYLIVSYTASVLIRMLERRLAARG